MSTHGRGVIYMSDRDEIAAAKQADVESVIEHIIRIKTDHPKTTAEQLAKSVGWPLGWVQAILARLVRYQVVKPAHGTPGIRKAAMDYIDRKYKPKK